MRFPRLFRGARGARTHWTINAWGPYRPRYGASVRVYSNSHLVGCLLPYLKMFVWLNFCEPKEKPNAA
jgi:hypothetical protein